MPTSSVKPSTVRPGSEHVTETGTETQSFDEATRVDPPLRSDEVTILRGFLDFHRDTLRWKCAGLTREQLGVSLPPSDMTLGGMMKHLAAVESSWFDRVFSGRELMSPFDTVDWESDPDWEWRTAADDTPAQLRTVFDASVQRANAVIDAALRTEAGLESLSARGTRRAPTEQFSLRWILVHMVEEYCRHNGHADLIRQSIDGQVGE
jgi:uncharacterized damage-inducible protein DinB